MKFVELTDGQRGVVYSSTPEKVLVQFSFDKALLVSRNAVRRFFARDRRRQWQNEILEKVKPSSGGS